MLHLGPGTAIIDRLRTGRFPDVTGGPLVSVIMPAFNAGATIRAAAGSILGQTWRNLELLIIDDASEDDTWAAMQELAAADGRVRILRNRINVGPYVSKNTALALAAGEWITGHDADDWAQPRRIEQHLAAVLSAPEPPRASLTFMIRLEPDGFLDRFAQISSYSPDGVSRQASIAALFAAGFLRQEIGGWDTVRFGADSELIARAQILLGDEFVCPEQIGMFAINLPDGLTNHPETGISRTASLSDTRLRYKVQYQAWHATIADGTAGSPRIAFPPAPDAPDPIAAPDGMRVPRAHVMRNQAVLVGDDPLLDQPVTAICVSCRPWFTARIGEMLAAQTHRNLHVVHVAHGPGHDAARTRAAFGDPASFTALSVPDRGVTLGECLNLALDHCRTDLVTRIDDDDFYGPDHIRGLLAAWHYHGHANVGLVGKERIYLYSEALDRFGILHTPKRANALRPRVAGGTMFWSRKRIGDQRFSPQNTGEDSAFIAGIVARGMKIYSADPCDHVGIRYARPGAHTWQIEAEEYMSKAQVIGAGLRLDLAYGRAMEPGPSAVPSHGPETATGGGAEVEGAR
ncbi:MAG: glycosyltransferase [Rubellimicrobium sp.]|nr:glycosyltransferase [Rubellimicrobium sp.]